MAVATAAPFNEQILRRIGVAHGGLNGSGIAIGFADWGFDLLHPTLLDASGRVSRFDAVWDQNGAAHGDARRGSLNHEPSVPHGRLLDRGVIDAVVAQSLRTGTRAPVDEVLDPHENYCWRTLPDEGAHGTLMASIAAGSAFGGFRGVADGARLLAVQLAMRESDWKEVDESGEPTWRDWLPAQEPHWRSWRDYDDLPSLAAALDWFVGAAKSGGASGLVINLSLGAACGAHDGCSPIERAITRTVRDGQGNDGLPTVVVVAAGNAGADEGHHAGCVAAGTPTRFSWRMSPVDPTPNKLEIWYRSEEPLGIELVVGERRDGSADALARFAIAAGPTLPILLGGRLAGIADHAIGVRNGLSRARIILHPPYFPRAMPRDDFGEITFGVRLVSAQSRPVDFNAWLERDDGLAERSFLVPSHPAGSLSTIAMAEGAIAVAGFDDRDGPTGPGVFALSALGPAPWPHLAREQAPHICAPGLGIWGAKSKSQGFGRTSGTSPAAAIVSGVAALLMQDDVRAGRRPCAARIRDRIAALARPVTPHAEKEWCPRFGWGAVDVNAVPLEEAP